MGMTLIEFDRETNGILCRGEDLLYEINQSLKLQNYIKLYEMGLLSTKQEEDFQIHIESLEIHDL